MEKLKIRFLTAKPSYKSAGSRRRANLVVKKLGGSTDPISVLGLTE